MALRALVYSKNPLTATVLAPVFKGLGIEAEVCGDALNAIEKVTRQAFSCVIADWADQPESGFLLKRARESVVNPNVVAVAVVESEPAAVEIREHRLDFLLYRPITVGEAAAVLSKACQGSQVVTPVLETEPDPEPEFQSPLEPFHSDRKAPDPEDPNLVSVTASVPKPLPVPEVVPEPKPEPRKDVSEQIQSVDHGPNFEQFVARRSSVPTISFHATLAIVLAAGAAFAVWQGRTAFQYLAQTPEGGFHVLRDAASAFFFTTDTVPAPVSSQAEDSQQDAYFVRPGESSRRPRLGIVATESDPPDAALRRHKPFDFPLPTPTYDPPKPPPVHVGTVHVPDSLKGSLPIGPPVVATDPAHIMPVSVPAPRIPEFNEPVLLSEDAARALLVHTVTPVYPRDAAAQKLQGPVVLQALIGRDGSVEDLKIVRGYFVLSRAAIAAVKQWRFKPYMFNNRAAQVQTTITIDFGHPQG